MNFLAGFLILIVAESVVSERDGVDATAAASESNTRLSGAGRATGGKQDNAPSVNQQQQRPAVGERGGNSAGGGGGGDEELSGSRRSSGGAGGGGSRSGGFGQDVKLTADEVAIVENECVEVLLGIVSLQGGVLSRDLHGLHAVSGRRE